MSEQITEAESYVGIDVSGSWLDIHILPEGGGFECEVQHRDGF